MIAVSRNAFTRFIGRQGLIVVYGTEHGYNLATPIPWAASEPVGFVRNGRPLRPAFRDPPSAREQRAFKA